MCFLGWGLVLLAEGAIFRSTANFIVLIGLDTLIFEGQTVLSHNWPSSLSECLIKVWIEVQEEFAMPDFKALREARGMTQNHLAEAAGLSVKTVVRLEKGEQVSAETMMAVRSVLDMGVPSSPVEANSKTLQAQVNPVPIEPPPVDTASQPRIWRASVWKGWFPSLRSAIKVPAIFLATASVGAIMMFGGGLFFGFPQGTQLNPVNRIPVVEALGLGSESLLLTHGRGLLVRADVLTSLGPVPAIPAREIHWQARTASQPLPWPEAITIGLSDSERERVRSTSWTRNGLFSDSEKITNPTEVGISLLADSQHPLSR